MIDVDFDAKLLLSRGVGERAHGVNEVTFAVDFRERDRAAAQTVPLLDKGLSEGRQRMDWLGQEFWAWAAMKATGAGDSDFRWVEAMWRSRWRRLRREHGNGDREGRREGGWF